MGQIHRKTHLVLVLLMAELHRLGDHTARGNPLLWFELNASKASAFPQP